MRAYHPLSQSIMPHSPAPCMPTTMALSPMSRTCCSKDSTARSCASTCTREPRPCCATELFKADRMAGKFRKLRLVRDRPL